MVTIPVEYRNRDVTAKESEADSGLDNNRPDLPDVFENIVSVHGDSVLRLISPAPGPIGLDDTEFTNILIELNWQ